jgi:lysyl-tRNA synthetase class 2
MTSVGHESRSRILEIEFQSGECQYLDVSKMVHEGSLRAESKGQYFNGEIRDDYGFARVDARRTATSK